MKCSSIGLVVLACVMSASVGLAQPAQLEAVPVLEGVHSGTLGLDDGCDEDGRFLDAYEVEMEAGMWYRIWVHSGAFDPTLTVFGPADLELDSDDFVPGALFSGIQFVPSLSGLYRIEVTPFASGESGDYELGVVPIDDDVSSQTLVLGSSVTSTTSPLGFGAAALNGAQFVVEARAGERLQLRVISTDFDTTATLFGPNGRTWQNDDANDTGPSGNESTLDSTILAVAPQDGLYQLLIVPYGNDPGGSFSVRSEGRDPVVLEPGQALPEGGYAGTDSAGRVLGLFAGISDYPGEDSDLYGCSDDASFLAEAFRERGLQSEVEQTVLLDEQVTREFFMFGLEKLASHSTPDDVVIIFYSGHGGQTETTADPNELDGVNETLWLWAGELTDDEVVAVIDRIEANTIILALDSCHAGGFARDFMTRPGRIGLFSSEEDVLSDTAEPLRAGGYLSYYLRRAVLGDADSRPADGGLAVGELTDFIYRGFLESHDDMNSDTSSEPYQRLTADRGSLAWNDFLWLYPRRPDGSLIESDAELASEEPEGEGGGGCE